MGRHRNVASRLETSAEENGIHVSQAVVDELGQTFEFESRGTVELKVKGGVTTYALLGCS
jgi:class 3 adenylate cyclase